jgi:hypothetical protein
MPEISIAISSDAGAGALAPPPVAGTVPAGADPAEARAGELPVRPSAARFAGARPAAGFAGLRAAPAPGLLRVRFGLSSVSAMERVLLGQWPVCSLRSR